MDIFLNYLLYAGTGILLLIVGLILFELATKIKEFEEIKNGNEAAAMSLGGKLLGLSFVIGSSVANSVSLIDMLIWSGIAILSQIIFFYIAEFVTVRFSISDAIEKNNRAVGIMHLLFSLSIGWVLAQCLTY